MACLFPRPAWREEKPNHNGNHEITFRHKGSQLDNDHLIPCGKCDGCHADKSLNWAIRMYHEAQTYTRNCFLTLTYENAPPALSREHVQEFCRELERMRRLHRQSKIRYFVCGEYGEKTRRPHYHAIIFGEDFLGGNTRYKLSDQLYGNAILDQIWGHGHAAIGDFQMAAACYVAGYVNKKVGDPDTFNLMSLRPPIGKRWAKRNIEELARLGHVVINGQKLPIPKEYFKWFPVELDHIKANRQSMATEHSADTLRAKALNFKARKRLREEKL